MARVTVEDCILKVPDLFELIVLAAQRSRDIGSGAPLTVERDNDKTPVVSLREIAGGTVSLDKLRESVLGNFRNYVEAVDTSLDLQEFLHEEEKTWLSQGALEDNLSSEAEDGSSSGDSFSNDTNLYSS